MGRAGLLILSAALLSPAPPAAPAINEPSTDGQIVNPADVHMEATGFADPDPGDTHASSDWEIWRVSPSERVWSAPAATGLSAVHLHLADGAFEGSLAGQTQLAYDTNWTLRVRFRDNNGEVSPFSTRAFRTSPAGPPGVATPIPWVPGQTGYRVELVATNFQLPVNIAFVPNPGSNATDPFFYVTELYGQIKVVRRDGTVGTYAQNLLNYNPVGAFPGAGEQGLTGVAVDPLTGDVYAGLLYEDSGTLEHYPRVVRFTSGDGGQTAATQSAILDMVGEAQGQSHQISNFSIGSDGKLYVHMGDGFATATAQDLAFFRGKIHRMNLDGSPAAGNPFYNLADGVTATDYVYAYGVRNPFGGDWRAADGFHYEVENGPSVDRFVKVTAGTNYGWNGSDASMTTGALYTWSPAHAPVNVVFVQPTTFAGSGYPAAKMDHVFVTESGPTYAAGPQALGKRLVEFVLDAAGNRQSGPMPFVEYAGTGKATAVGLAAGPDGLYFTDLYKDQGAAATDIGANVLRVRYTGTPPSGSGTGALGEYYDNINFTGTQVARTDPAINFSWGFGSPVGGIGSDTFSVRWTARVEPRYTETWTFYTQSNDGVRLWVNGQQIVNNWTDHSSTENAGTIALAAGQKHDLVMEYYDNTGSATAQLRWSCPNNPKEVVPQTQLYAPDLRDNDSDGLSNTLDLDDDNDLLPDVTDPDRDGDGFTNADEVAAGADPDDATSFPVGPPPPPPAPAGGRSSGGGCGSCGATGFLPALLLLALTSFRNLRRRFRNRSWTLAFKKPGS